MYHKQFSFRQMAALVGVALLHLIYTLLRRPRLLIRLVQTIALFILGLLVLGFVRERWPWQPADEPFPYVPSVLEELERSR